MHLSCQPNPQFDCETPRLIVIQLAVHLLLLLLQLWRAWASLCGCCRKSCSSSEAGPQGAGPPGPRIRKGGFSMTMPGTYGPAQVCSALPGNSHIPSVMRVCFAGYWQVGSAEQWQQPEEGDPWLHNGEVTYRWLGPVRISCICISTSHGLTRAHPSVFCRLNTLTTTGLPSMSARKPKPTLAALGCT